MFKTMHQGIMLKLATVLMLTDFLKVHLLFIYFPQPFNLYGKR